MIMRENRNIPFRDWNIRVSRNHSGHLHICAMDVCNILKRSELLEDGAIARICPTALRISFRKNGREQWSFRPIDMRRLLRMVRKETIIPRDMLNELEAWGNQLLELESDDLHAAAQNDIILHFMEGFPVTFRRIGDKRIVLGSKIIYDGCGYARLSVPCLLCDEFLYRIETPFRRSGLQYLKYLVLRQAYSVCPFQIVLYLSC